MGKIKVYELARKLNIQNSEMIDKLKSIGIEVKSHLSTVDEEPLNLIITTINKTITIIPIPITTYSIYFNPI